ncbi:MAG: heme lyase CcmF/NrfE family subunit [Methylophagaceae bacterium]
MIPEIGHAALIIAFTLAVFQALLPLVGAQLGNGRWINLATPLARGQWLFIAISYACLTYSFLVNDFSVRYVASTSNTQLPLLYKISGVWGAHEGSLLLWALLLSSWTFVVSIFSKSIPKIMLARVLSVMGMVSVGFISFMLFTSNPFVRLFPAPVDGRSLNPLLQDPGLAIHPPMLYMGYVGFSVAFAFAIAAMIDGKLDAAWARWVRPWTNIAWVFMTLGIALGSWWAYYELGWGGWWFWDPVENASLMPWLVGTALIHSLAVTEKRAAFKSWTVLLAIFAFSLSLLGTFLVRSGVLTSVHAFATDPARGVFILVFLIIVVGGSLVLYAWRAPALRSVGQFSVVSRETGLLLNNVVLVTMAGTVLLGTLYPLVLDAFGVGKISVGPPYFNQVMLWLAIPLYLAMGLGFFLRWKKDSVARIQSKIVVPFAIVLVFAVLLPLLFAPEQQGLTFIGLILASWVALAALLWILNSKISPFKLPASTWGAVIAHIGMAVTVTGITLTSVYSHEKDVRLAPGESYQVGDYQFRLIGVKEIRRDNYIAYQGIVEASQDGQHVALMHPEKRTYGQSSMPMTEAAIDAGLFRDLFVALGEPLGQGSWSLRIYHKPFVRWIWMGALIMAFGGLLAAADKRYRRLRKTKVKVA